MGIGEQRERKERGGEKRRVGGSMEEGTNACGLCLGLVQNYYVIIVTQSVLIQMMQSNALTPKSFLKSQEMRESYECGICYEICIKPVKCKGSCARIFCMKCVSDTKQILDKCPNRCSVPFLVSPIPDIQVEFYCPYNPTLCPHSITSVKSFNQHYQLCQYVSSDEIYRKKLQKQYKCRKAHHLQFFIGSYEEMVGSTCIECGQQKLCRSFCRICEQFYCVTCRVPPCSKEGCPIGHGFNFQRIANINYICDICGISTAVSNDGVYDCSLCNFGLCEGCYSQLPQKFDQSKPKSIIANINTQCACGNNLIFINSVHQPSTCQLCHKNKQCPKYCQNCQKRYCLGCKLMDIYSDSTCRLQHDIIKVKMTGNQQFMQKQNVFGCMKCSMSVNQYYYDKQCKTRLCQNCYGYSMKVTTDKERPILIKCDKNHVLMYINDPGDYYQTCCKCQKNKIIKLVCNYCGEDQRLYCFECKQILLETCYYKHALKLAKFQGERQCHICLKNYNQFHYCKKCFFFVCKNCMQLNIQSKQMQPEQQERNSHSHHHHLHPPHGHPSPMEQQA